MKLSKEHAELAPIIEAVQAYRTTERELKDAEALANDSAADADMRAMAEEERQTLKEQSRSTRTCAQAAIAAEGRGR